MINMFDEIRSNKIKSYGLIFVFIILIGVMGSAIGFYYDSIYFGVGMAVIFGLIYTLISYFSGDSMILTMTGAKPVTKKEYPHLYHTVEGLAIAAGVPPPKAYVINDTALNAFATGRDPEHASITVTTGLLNKLNRQELEGVVAHEMSHIKNYDIRMMMLTAVLIGIVTLLSDFLLRSFLWGRGAIVNYLQAIGESFNEGRTGVLGFNSDAVKTFMTETVINDPFLLENIIDLYSREFTHAEHLLKVMAITNAFCNHYGFSPEETRTYTTGALGHDFGKNALPLEILKSPYKLTPDQLKEMRKHPEIGYEIIKGSDLDDRVALVARDHHRRLNGKGYPNLPDEKIGEPARLVSIVDDYEACTTDFRRYNGKVAPSSALDGIGVCVEDGEYDKEFYRMFREAVLAKRPEKRYFVLQ